MPKINKSSKAIGHYTLLCWFIHVYMYTYTYIYIHTHTYTHTHTHTYTYTHTYQQRARGSAIQVTRSFILHEFQTEVKRDLLRQKRDLL